MAETVEGLVTEAGADVTGLDRGLQQSLALVQRFTQQVATAATSLPPLDINTQALSDKLRGLGAGDVGQFFAGLSQGIQEGLAEVQREVSAQHLTLPPIDVDQVLVGLRQGVTEGLADVQRLAATQHVALPPLDASALLTSAEPVVREALVQLQAAVDAAPPIVVPPPVVPPITPPEPPNFSETIAETIRAADVMRTEFLSAFPVQALGIEAKQAAAVAVDQLESGLLSRVGELRDLLAADLISPAAFTAQVDQAIEAMAREIETRQASLPELVLRVRNGAAQDTGVITNQDLANVGQFDQLAAGEDAATASATRLQTAMGAVGQASQAAAARLAEAAAAGAGPLASAALAAATQAELLARSEAVAVQGSAQMAAGLARAAAQAELLTAAEAAASTGAGRMAAGFAAASAQRAELDALTGTVAQVEPATNSATRGLNLMRGAAVSLAAQSLGTRGSVGSLAAGLLFLADIPVAVVVGIASLVLIMEKLEGSTKRAREETDKLIDKLRQASESRLPVFTQIGHQIDDVSTKIGEASRRITELQVRSAAQGLGGRRIFGADLDGEIERVKVLKALLVDLKAQQEDLNRTAIRAASTQRVDDDLAVTQQGIQGRQELLQHGFQEELVDQQTFFAQRRALTIQAATADKSALGDKLSQDLGTDTRKLSPDQVTNLRAEEDHLRTQITLRQTLLNQQLAAIDHEEAMAGLLLLHEQRLLRIQRAGGGNLAQSGPVVVQPPVEVPVILRPALQREQNGTNEGDETAAELLRAARAGAELLIVLRGVDLSLRDIGNANITGIHAGLQEAANTAARVVNGLTDVAAAFGDIGQQAQQGLQGVNQLFGSIEAFASGDILGGVLGGLGAIANIGNALFGSSPLERERDAQTERLISAIEHLTVTTERHGAAITGEQAAGAIAAAAAVDTRDPTRAKSPVLSPQQFDAAVTQAISKFGVDIQDLNAIAQRELGVSLLDSHGNLIPAAVEAFDQAIKDGTISVTDLTDATKAATEAMLNVPDVFKVDTARASVQSAVAPPPPPVTATAPGAGTTNNAPQSPGTRPDGGKVPVQTSSTTTIGSVNITVQGTGDPAAVAKATREEFERAAMRTHGQSDYWGATDPRPDLP